MKEIKKVRIDRLLVERGLADSREKAQALVMAGQVFVDGKLVDKPGRIVAPGLQLRVEPLGPVYASRGGIKLAAALDHFGIEVREAYCLDVGASTGGFSDCLLQRGASHVTALDVGRHQLSWRLRNDSRVEVRDGVNARYLSQEDFTRKFDVICIDVSFISLKKVLPAIFRLVRPGGHVLALIKPQFEVGMGEVGSGGIVRDPRKHRAVISSLRDWLGAFPEIDVQGVTESPITGAEGNVEFFICMSCLSG